GESVAGEWGRSGDDLLLVYTGGTTGMPKGVMWRQDDLWAILNRTGELRYPEDGSTDDVRRVLEAPLRHPWPRLLPGPPLMHGTALFTAFSVLNSGGSIVLSETRSFSAPDMLDTISREGVTQISIVGDAFARPLLAELDANPDRYDLSALWLIVSSGVMWSAEVRAGLLRHHPGLTLVDSLGSSEALGMGRSTSGKGSTPGTAGFQLSPETRVLAEDGSQVEPGSGRRGLVALPGRGPIGYYKDPEKTAGTFRVIDGKRWVIPGDFATVEADGSVRLLGRGSVCINTGGEKVFPEEVEESLKRHPGVRDAVVVGVAHERFGEMVVGVVEPEPGTAPDPVDMIAWVRERLADYKSPRHILLVDTIGRSPSGKVDYQRLKAYSATALR
ncbi:MAG: AMP-binding protein, partial [Actinomycetes bacterium]